MSQTITDPAADAQQQIKEIVRRLSATRDSLDTNPDLQQMYSSALAVIRQLCSFPDSTPKVKDVTRQLVKLQSWKELDATVHADMLKMILDVQAGNFTPCVEISKDWSDKVPAVAGWHWHWSGAPDSPAVLTSVQYNSTSDTFLVSMAHLGIYEAIDCDKYGGFWIALKAPAVPATPAHYVRTSSPEFSL